MTPSADVSPDPDKKMLDFDLVENSDKLKIPSEVYERIVIKSLTTTPEDLKEIEEAVAVKDYDRMRLVSHRLKGIYSNLRIEALYISAEQMEHIAKDKGNLPAFKDSFNEFKMYFTQLQSLFAGD